MPQPSSIAKDFDYPKLTPTLWLLFSSSQDGHVPQLDQPGHPFLSEGSQDDAATTVPVDSAYPSPSNSDQLKSSRIKEQKCHGTSQCMTPSQDGGWTIPKQDDQA